MPNTPQTIRTSPSLLKSIAAAATLALAGNALFGAETKAGAVDLSKLPPPATKKVDFAKEIQPILKNSCLDCHGQDMQMGKLRLDKKEAALKGGENGPAIVPGKSAQSRLIHYVSRLVKGKEMPPGDPLPKEQIGLLRAWIDQGANW